MFKHENVQSHTFSFTFRLLVRIWTARISTMLV